MRSVFASWSPDAKKLLFAQGSDLYLANYDGTNPQKLVTVPGIPGWVESYISGWPRWSPDAKRIRFSLQDPQTLSFAIWEVSADGSNLHPLLPGWNNPPAECCGVWTPDGKYFIFQSTRNGRTDLWAIREKANLFERAKREPIQLTSGPMSFLGPNVDRDGKLFALGTQSKNELVRYDVRSKQLSLYLSGISAEGVDFSRDGQRLTYVAIPDGTLWRSKLDGSQRSLLSRHSKSLCRSGRPRESKLRSWGDSLASYGKSMSCLPTEAVPFKLSQITKTKASLTGPPMRGFFCIASYRQCRSAMKRRW